MKIYELNQIFKICSAIDLNLLIFTGVVNCGT